MLSVYFYCTPIAFIHHSVFFHLPRPFILDENIDDIRMLLRTFNDRAADVVNLKISKLGGLTKTKQVNVLQI